MKGQRFKFDEPLGVSFFIVFVNLRQGVLLKQRDSQYRLTARSRRSRSPYFRYFNPFVRSALEGRCQVDHPQ